jgi:hypothetical protein
LKHHPSLTTEFVAPDELRPVQSMPVNEPCWCGSGQKWKKCHRDRERQEPIHIFKLLDEQRAEFAHGSCMHPDAPKSCSRKIIRAHTVQRRGGLAAIAENGHVISGKKGFEEIFRNNGVIVPREVGVNHASTFMGFCDVHDDQLFAPIEKAPVTLDKQAAFLLSFRAVCYEYCMKQVAYRSVDIQRQLDEGRDFEFQCFLQQHLHIYREGVKRALRDLGGWKQTYDNAYRSGTYEDFSFYAVQFAQPLPIVACGAFHPEFDFGGNALQIITRGESGFGHVCFNLTVINGKSVAVIGRTGEPGGRAEQFCNSFKALPKIAMANAVFHLACEHLENTYFRPSWWGAQSDQAKQHLIDRFRSGMGASGPERQADCLSNFQYTFASSDVEQELF